MQRKPDVTRFVHSCMTSLTLNSKLFNFITSWKMIKTQQTWCDSLSTQYTIKTGLKFWLQDPFNSSSEEVEEVNQLKWAFRRVFFFFRSEISGKRQLSNVVESQKWGGLKNDNKSSHRRCSIEKMFLKISQYSHKNTCVGVSNTVAFKNTYFEEHLRTAASKQMSRYWNREV